MKNLKLYALAGMLVVLALALTSCGSKGKLTITNISADYTGYYIVGYENSGDYLFAASVSTTEDIDIKGAEVKKNTVTLNVYEVIDTDDLPLFTGETSILRGNLIICLSDSETYMENSKHEFINNKVVNFTKGSAKIDLAADFELFD